MDAREIFVKEVKKRLCKSSFFKDVLLLRNHLQIDFKSLIIKDMDVETHDGEFFRKGMKRSIDGNYMLFVVFKTGKEEVDEDWPQFPIHFKYLYFNATVSDVVLDIIDVFIKDVTTPRNLVRLLVENLKKDST